jgi:hypothetical protein
VLQQLVQENIDWYLDELVEEMQKRTGKHVSVPTLWRSLAFCGISRKRVCSSLLCPVIFNENASDATIQLMKSAQERNDLLRGAFINKIAEFEPEQLIFLDEAAKDERSLSRGYGYAFTNARACKKTVFVRGQRYTILPALSLEGIIALDVMEGSCTKTRFRNFILSHVVGLHVFHCLDYNLKFMLTFFVLFSFHR